MHAGPSLSPIFRRRLDQQVRGLGTAWNGLPLVQARRLIGRPYRPQTNGKIERFHRTLADGWAFSRHYNSESARRAALPAWIHEYNHYRPHTAIGTVPPITRLTNLPGQYN